MLNSYQRSTKTGFQQVPRIETLRKETPEDLEPFRNDFISYTDYYHAFFVIGDEDLSKSHTTVTAYQIDNENGFNLTEFDTYLAEITQGKVTIEIHHGSIYSEAELVISKEIDDTTEGSKFINFESNESYFFPYGDVIWLTVKIPAGNLYPIGVSPTNGHPNAANYQWLSFDDGRSFTLIEEAIGKPNYAFTQGVFSNQQYQGDYLSITPIKGEINGNGETTINVSADISKIRNGTVQTNLLIKSNDEEQQEARVTTQINVSGHSPNLVAPEIVDFGSVQLGIGKEVVVRLDNYGYGIFKGSINWEGLEGTAFSIEGTKPWTIFSRSSYDIKLKFDPQVEGNSSAILSITDFNNNNVEIHLFGNGELPSEIDVTPKEQLVNLSHGETTNGSITIDNLGQYPLQFNIPKYSDIESEGHEYGYSWEVKNEGFTWEELNETEGTIDITSAFINDPFLSFVELDLGFQFPFYDTLVDKMYMSHVGLVAVDDKDPVNGSWGDLLGRNFTSNGYFAIMYDYFDLLHDSKLLYKKFDDHVIFEWYNVHSKEAFFRSGDPMTFQLALHYNGNVEMRYLDLNYSNSTSIDPFLGVESPDKQDGFYIYEFIQQPNKIFENNFQNVWIDIKYPGTEIISNLSTSNGVVAPGASQEITFDISADGLVDGINTQNIAIKSNDPINPITKFTINVDVNGGGESIVSTSNRAINFGEVFKGAEHFETINFINEGNSNASIVSGVFENGNKLSIDKENFVLRARLGTVIKLSLNTDEIGFVQDKLSFTDDNGQKYDFTIVAEIVGAPAINIDQTPLNYTLDAGDSTHISVEISNIEGDTTLRMVPVGSNWLYQKEVASTMNNTIEDFQYYIRDNDLSLKGVTSDVEEPKFAWFDVHSNGGLKLKMDHKLWSEVELEYPVKFYDKEYSKIWVGYTGIISFEEPIGFSPIENGRIPKQGGFNNFIACFWGLTGYDGYDENPNKGMWFYADSEKTIISYERWVHAFGEGRGGYVYAQTIIFKDGRIKMQYKTIAQDIVRTWNNLLSIGVENETGDIGVQANYYKSLVKDQLAIEFTPSNVVNVPKGETKTLDFVINADHLYAGNYSTDLTFVNHTPNKENISVPVNLIVTGSSDLSFSTEVIDFGDIIYTPWMNVTKEFEVLNNGTAHHTFIASDITADASSGLEFYGLLEEFIPSPWPPIPNWNAHFLVVDPFFKPFIFKVGEAFPARISLRPNEPGVHESIIVLNKADGTTEELLVKANFILPSKFNSNVPDTLDVYANNIQDKRIETFIIDNKEGDSPLTYNFVIDYNVNQKDEEEFTLARNTIIPLVNSDAPSYEINNLNSKDYSEFHRALYYGNKDASPTTAIGYNGSQKMTSITMFNSKDEPFDLSHISTWYIPNGKSNGELEVNIYRGTIDAPVLVHHQLFNTELNEEDKVGVLLTLQLDEVLNFYPSEQFFVAITYPQESIYPQGIEDIGETIENTFYIPLEDGWFDLTQDQNFSSIVYMVHALAKNESEGIWFSLDHQDGIIEVGDSIIVNAQFDPQFAFGSKNLEAKVSIQTNDPNVSLEDTTFYALMSINRAPIAKEMADSIKVNEGDTLVFEIDFEDIEGDSFDLSIQNEIIFSRSEIIGSQVKYTFTPNFDESGIYQSLITAVDQHGNENVFTVRLIVEDVNRAPVISDLEDIELQIGEILYFDALSVIEDLDGDDFTFGIADNQDGVLITGVSENDFVITALSEGQTEVAIMAMDIHGESTLKVVNVIVLEEEDIPTGIDDSSLNNSFNLSNYPNPTSKNTTFTFTLMKNVNVGIMIHNIQGVKVSQLELGLLQQGEYQIPFDTSELNTGVYIYTLIINGEPRVFNKFIKN